LRLLRLEIGKKIPQWNIRGRKSILSLGHWLQPIALKHGGPAPT